MKLIDLPVKIKISKYRSKMSGSDSLMKLHSIKGSTSIWHLWWYSLLKSNHSEEESKTSKRKFKMLEGLAWRRLNSNPEAEKCIESIDIRIF